MKASIALVVLIVIACACSQLSAAAPETTEILAFPWNDSLRANLPIPSIPAATWRQGLWMSASAAPALTLCVTYSVNGRNTQTDCSHPMPTNETRQVQKFDLAASSDHLEILDAAFCYEYACFHITPEQFGQLLEKELERPVSNQPQHDEVPV